MCLEASLASTLVGVSEASIFSVQQVSCESPIEGSVLFFCWEASIFVYHVCWEASMASVFVGGWEAPIFSVPNICLEASMASVLIVCWEASIFSRSCVGILLWRQYRKSVGRLYC